MPLDDVPDAPFWCLLGRTPEDLSGHGEGNRASRPLTKRWACGDARGSANPELVDQHLPHRVVLVVADALRDYVDDLGADERHPGRLVDGVAFRALPQATRGARARSLRRSGLLDLVIDARIAEFGGVRVPRAGHERGAREQLVEEAGRGALTARPS